MNHNKNVRQSNIDFLRKWQDICGMLQFSLLQGLFSLWNIMEQHQVSNVLRRDVLTSGTRFTSQLSLYVSFVLTFSL